MRARLFLIKFFHSLIFWYMAACLVYIPYTALARAFNWLLLAALASVFLEGAALLINHGRCPLRSLAEKYGAESGSVTDIFLPDVVARNIFRFSLPLFILELLFLTLQYFTR